MNNSRRKIDASDFKKLCKVKNLTNFGGFRIERDGVYLNRLEEATLRLLSEEEKKVVQGWHPTGRYHEPALRFPCDVDEFLNFVNEHGLAGCIHGPTLAEWLQLAAPDTAPSGAREVSPPDVEMLRKRSALIAEFAGMWPTIERDLKDSKRSGLTAAAKASTHGDWKVREALNWAAEQGKIQPEKAEAFVRAEGESEVSVLVRTIMLSQGRK